MCTNAGCRLLSSRQTAVISFQLGCERRWPGDAYRRSPGCAHQGRVQTASASRQRSHGTGMESPFPSQCGTNPARVSITATADHGGIGATSWSCPGPADQCRVQTASARRQRSHGTGMECPFLSRSGTNTRAFWPPPRPTTEGSALRSAPINRPACAHQGRVQTASARHLGTPRRQPPQSPRSPAGRIAIRPCATEPTSNDQRSSTDT